MAALGAITQGAINIGYDRLIHWWTNNRGASLSDVKGIVFTSSLSGNVDVQGVNQDRNVVYLYSRDSGLLIKKTWTDSSGNFSFTKLPPTSQGYFVVAITDYGGNYNALVLDKLTPA